MNKRQEQASLKIVLVISMIILLTTIILIVKRKNDIQRANQAKVLQIQQNNKIKAENYKKLQEVFKEYEPSLSTIMDGFQRTSLIKSELDFSIRLSDGDIEANDKYTPKSVVEQIKKDKAFYNDLKKLLNKEEIYQITYKAKLHDVHFYVTAEKTPYITNNNSLGTAFIYCTDKNCKKYGYYTIKENWYMWILPRPE